MCWQRATGGDWSSIHWDVTTPFFGAIVVFFFLNFTMWGKTVRQTPSRNGHSATSSWLKGVPYHPFWPNKTPGFEDLHTTLKLVGGLEHEFYDFPYIGNVIIPTDETHIFQRGRSTTNQLKLCPTCPSSWTSRVQRMAPHDLAVCQNLVPLVNIKIAGKWMFIPLKMVLLGV